MKRCSKCKEEKNLSEFVKRKASKDGMNHHCRKCSRAYINQHYQNNKKYYNDKRRQYQKDIRVWYQEYKKTLVCNECGFNHPAALDFHHKDDNKEQNISQMQSSGSKRKIMEEIKKCIVFCANCHRIHHFNESRSARVETESWV